MVFGLCKRGENRATYIFTNRSYMLRLHHRSHRQAVQNYKQETQCRHNVTLRRVRAKQRLRGKAINITYFLVIIFSLRYPA
jgi:hypothetical protein